MDISLIFRIAAIGIITAVITQLLKKADKDEIATLVTLTGLIIALLMVIDLINTLFGSLQTIFGAFG